MNAGKSFFDENLKLLKDLFKSQEKMEKPIINCVLRQLRNIFNKTEKAWNKNLECFNNDNKVKYLLICEAPPWTFSSIATYFYLQQKGPLFSTVRKAFFGNPQEDRQNTYICLAKEGFLLIDSLPYSMPYTTAQRKSDKYLKLIKACIPWWIEKLNNSGLTFSSDMKIAFGYYWNGKQIIYASVGSISASSNLTIGGNKYSINTNQIISHQKSRYFPDYKKLKNIYLIDKTLKCP